MVRTHKQVAVRLAGLVVVMVSLSFAAVPFYDWFCRVTGYGGTTTQARDNASEILDREITIRFDGSVTHDMPWVFKPVKNEVTIRIGETGLAFYEAYNPTDRPVAGSASYNVVPFSAGSHFVKIDCFCFQEQVLQPGQRVQMPVTFYVDPEITEDPEARRVQRITLSYTFNEIDLPVEATAERADDNSSALN